MAIRKLNQYPNLTQKSKVDLVKKLSSILKQFEKQNSVTLESMLEDDMMPSPLHDIVYKNSVRLFDREMNRRHEMKMNQMAPPPPTPAEVFESMTKGFGVLPAKDQNNVLCQLIHDLKEKRSKHAAGTIKDLETAQSNADNAAASLKSLDAILGGSFDSLYIR